MARLICKEKHLLSKSVTIDPLEIKKYYDANKNDLKSFEVAKVSIFKFKDKPSAISELGKITEHFKPNQANTVFSPSNLSGLSSAKQHVEIQLSDTINNVNLINAIAHLNIGEVSIPIDMNGEFWVIYLFQKNGTAILPYKYAKAEIEKLLPKKKEKEAYDRALGELKARYVIKINLLKEFQKLKN